MNTKTDLDWDALYKALSRNVQRLSYRILKDHHLAEDNTQDTFELVWKKFHQFKGDSQLSTWVHSVAKNRALQQLRDNKALTCSLNGAGNLGYDPPESDCLALKSAIESLHELDHSYGDTFRHHVYTGLSSSELAVAENISLGCAKSRLVRGRIAAKKLFNAKAKAAKKKVNGYGKS